MADEQIIIEVVYDTDQAQQNVNDLTKDVVALENANKDLKKQLKDGTISQEDYSKAVESNRVALAKNKAERKDNIQFLKAEKGSQDQLQKSVKLLTNERKKLNLETEEGRAQAVKLNKQIDEMRDSINENSSSLEQNKNNIGNYTDSIKEAISGSDLFGGSITNITQSFTNISSSSTQVTNNIGQVSKGFGGLTKAALKFILTPIGAIIAAIVVAIKLLSSALKRNEGFMDAFSEAFAGISNVIETVIGRIQRLVNIAGKLIKGQITLNEAIEEGSHAFEGMADEMKNAYDEGVKLKQLQKEIEQTNIANTKTLASLNAEYEKQSAIADDATLSFAKQTEALNKAAEAGKKAAEIESQASALALQEINKRIEIAERNGSQSRALYKEQAEAIAGQIEAESRLTQVVFENNKKRREIQLDLFEQELDYILDVADVRKTANEKIIADEEKTFAKREEILNKTKELLNTSFDEQIALFEAQNAIQIDTAKLLELNNKESAAYAFSLGMSERATNRLLEVIRERIAATSDLQIAEEEFEASRQEFFDAESERRVEEMDAELMAIEETTNAELEAQNMLFENNMANTEALTEAEMQAAEQKRQITLAATNMLVNSFQQILDARVNSLNRQREKELANENLTEAQKEAIQKKYAKKQQKIQITQAIISGALGVLNALQTQPFFPLGLLAAAGAAITTGVQIANIKNQSFAEGGLAKSGTFGGRSHAAGGTRGVFSDGTRIEVEKDENFYVMKRDASAHINALSSVNERFGGRSFGSGRVAHAADGGQIETTQNQGLNTQDVQDIIRQTPIEVKVTDIMSGINGNQQAQEVGVV